MPTFTAIRDDRSFIDAYGVTVHYYVWAPKAPKAVLHLIHGLGEYATRYETLAQELVGAGFAVYASDLRGHGRTGLDQWDGDTGRLGRLGTGGLRATIDDVRQLTGIIREEHAALPIVLLGHSLGSLIAQKILNTDARLYAAAVLTGTAYRMPGSMNGGDLNAKHKSLGDTGYEWLSRDAAISKAFLDDELTFTANVLKLFGVRDGLRLYGRPARRLHAFPVLIMIGGDDTLGGEKSVRRLADAYIRRSGLSDVGVVVYTDARHEVFNELNQADVRADLLAWLRARIPALDARPRSAKSKDHSAED